MIRTMWGGIGVAVLLGTSTAVEANEWTRFRGPNGSGVAETSGLPIELGPEKNVVWKTALPPGPSYATPAIADGKIYIRTETALYSFASFGSPEMPQSSGIHELVLERPNEKSLRYALSLPKRQKAGAPLVLSLHYAGHGAPYYGKVMLESLVEPALRDLDAVIVAPDCPSSSWTATASEDAVLALLDFVAESYRTDAERVVVTGYSMGGMGTWHLVRRHPDRFSAAIPMAGSPRDANIDAVARTPLYAIHSRTDEVVPLAPTSAAVARLKAAGARVELVIVDVPHYESVRFEPYLKKAVGWLREVWGDPSNR